MPRLKFLLVQCIATVVMAVGVPQLALAARGYVSRACGMDLDHDGTRGETADCLLCRGDATVANPAGGNWEQYYANCDTGDDTTGDGTAGAPYRSIKKTLTKTVTGGNTLVVCFTGTCMDGTGELFPLVPKAGIAGYYTITKTGSQEYDFQYPTKPAVIMGWDTDNDGSYPPYDTDDTSIIDGEYDNRLTFTNTAGSAIEFAHFTAKRFGRYGVAETRGFMEVNESGASASHLFVHDLVLDGILKDMEGDSESIVFNFFANELHYFAFENLNIIDWGAFLTRGASTDASYIRYQNLTATVHGDDSNDDPPELDDETSQFWNNGFKMWGDVDHIEFIDNMWDCQPDVWLPTGPGARNPSCIAIGITQCDQDMYIRNNEFRDFRTAVSLGPTASYCPDRHVDNIVIDRNEFINDWPDWSLEIATGVGSNEDTDTIDSIIITNNFFSATDGFEGFLWLDTSSTGTVTIVGNTMNGPIIRASGQAIQLSGKDNYVIKDNIVSGLQSGDVLFRVLDDPSSFNADYNVYDPDFGTFVWNSGSETNFAQWKIDSGADANSKQCDPIFVSASDFHLQSGDTCAKDAGTDMSGVTTVDYDNQTRSGTWDIGADEVADRETAPAAPTVVDVVPLP